MKLFTIEKNEMVPFVFQWNQKIGKLFYSDGYTFCPIKIKNKYKKKINAYLMRDNPYFSLDRIMEFIDFFAAKTSPEIAICTAFNDFTPFEVMCSYDEFVKIQLGDFINSNSNYTQLEKEELLNFMLQTIDKEDYVRFSIQKHLQEDKLDILRNASDNGFWVYNPIN